MYELDLRIITQTQPMAELILCFACVELNDFGGVIDVQRCTEVVNEWWAQEAKSCRSVAEMLDFLWVRITNVFCLCSKHGLTCTHITAENPVARVSFTPVEGEGLDDD